MKSRTLMCFTAMTLFGTPVVGLLLLSLVFVAWPAMAQTYSVLHSFTGADGNSPSAGLTRDAFGNLYGTTVLGGAFGAGVVFKLDPAGEETVLHSFTGGADGGFPQYSNLILDQLGDLYGTTTNGGSTACFFGCGVVFKLSAIGEETVLHSFTGGVDGADPFAGLVRDAAGIFYGSTESGTATGAGVVFRLTPAGNLDVLHSFSGGLDGGNLFGSLILDRSGNLYGASPIGGTSHFGLIFKLSPAGKETALYNFTGGNDGTGPIGPLVRDASGNLFGITESGGASGQGVVFKLDPSGKETVLYTFTGGADGGVPTAGLTRDASGNLYGTTLVGGTFGVGVVFKVSPTGTETVLYTFTGGADGGFPFGAVLLRDSSGNLYGTTGEGGSTACPFGCGVVFKLTPQ
jgi:uncharacterized repeat protein (TIGR03803 family)